MSSNYYAMRDAKVRIAQELSNRGWKIHNFKEDRSDSMTDYYDPANWSPAIATKNGFTLVIDCSHAEESKPIKKYNYSGCLTQSDKEKIKKLEALTVERGATEGEETNAKAMIEKIKNNASSEPTVEIIGYTIAHMTNPSHSKWHIEKDGAIYDKGIGITKYDSMPEIWEYDISKMEYVDGHKYYSTWENGEYVRKENTLDDETRKLINEFKSLMLRFDRAVTGMNTCGDGTKETEQEGLNQQQNEKMEKVIEKRVKKVLKMVEVTGRTEIKVGDYLGFSWHGGYWLVTDSYMRKGTWNGVQEERNAFSYERVGSASRGYKQVKNTTRYYGYEYQLQDYMKQNKVKIYELKEVEEIEEVEKWARVKLQNTVKNNKTNSKNEDAKTSAEQNTESVIEQNENNITVTLNEEKNGVEIKFNSKPSEEVRTELKAHGFRWSKFAGVWYAKQSDDTINFANSFVSSQAEQDQSNNTEVAAEQQPTFQATVEELGEHIVDKSTSLMEKYGLKYNTYSDSEEYKKDLLQYIKLYKPTKEQLQKVIDYITKIYNFEGLQEVLKGFLDHNQNSKQVTEQQENNKLIEKLTQQQESNDKKIDRLSGDYKTNTWKRMKEQESRDRQREELEHDNNIINYLISRIEQSSATEFEKALVVRSLRDQFNSYYRRYKEYNKVEYPMLNPSWDKNSDWAKETSNRINRLKKLNIFNEFKLKTVIEQDYEYIIDHLEQNDNAIEREIKKLENEYRMQQKGDIHFTPEQLVNTILDYADISEDDKVLEPSAGIGSIVDRLKEFTSNVDVVEWNNNFNNLLKLKGYNVIGSDFMELNNYNNYDKIVMNPPFSKECEHIKQAYKMLKNNGRLVAITSPHYTFANDKESKEFREWLNNLDYEIIDVDKNIQFDKTNVATKILIINKDEAAYNVAM